jgi:hypothetical protein
VVDDTRLDPVDERFVPLTTAIGRTVLGAAALERVLLVDILSRTTARQGLREELAHELSELERRPAGTLLNKLRELQIAPDLAKRIEEAIRRRNRLVHHFLEDPTVMAVLMTDAGVDQLVQGVDALAIEIQQIINLIAPGAFAGLQHALGADIQHLVEMIKSVDLADVEDPILREQFKLLQTMDPAQLDEFFGDAAGA